MAISPAVDEDRAVIDAADDTERSAADPNRRFRLVLTGVLVLLLVLAAGCLVWLLAERRGAAADAQRERDAVIRQTEQFVLRLNTYGPEDLDEQGHLTAYKDRVLGVMSAKFGSDFEQSGLSLAEQTVQQGYGRTAEVYGVGVDDLDGDSATVIVAGSLTGSLPDPKAPEDESKRTDDQPEVLRWSVDLVKVDGTWLVDDYAPVGAEGEGSAE
jgi:Mce-associated membrane protein